MSQDGEGDTSGKETGACVDEASDDGVLDAVVVELVVGSQGGQRSRPDRVGEEDLGGRIDPCLRVGQLRPVRGDVPAIQISKCWIIYFHRR